LINKNVEGLQYLKITRKYLQDMEINSILAFKQVQILTQIHVLKMAVLQ